MEIDLNLVISSRIYREVITEYLRSDPSICIRQSFDSLNCAMQDLENIRADVIVVDSPLDDLLPSIQRLKQIQHDPKIILMAFSFDDSTVHDCIAAGVEGFICSNDGMQDLKNCIFAINSGHLCYPSAFSRILTTGIRQQAASMPAVTEQAIDLTARQTSVLQLIASGFSNKEIARKLNIQTATVKNHVHQILERLKVKNRCAAASVYRRHGGRSSLESMQIG